MTNKRVTVSVRVRAKAGKEERVKFALKALIGPTRKEEGCISYNFHQAVNDKSLFISHEIWASQEVFLLHLETPYIKAMEDSAAEILAEPIEITIMEALS